jgi:pilus assembly protein TadC
MTLLAAMAAGAGIGLGIVFLLHAIHPRPVPLARALADLERPPSSPLEIDTTRTGQTSDRIGRASVRFFEATGLVDAGGLRHKLRSLDKPVERHAYEKLLGGIAGLLIPVLFTLVLAAAGVSVSPALTILAAVGLGIGGFMWPDIRLSEQIDRRRRDFRYSLSAYLDLVTIILAGGGGLETALQTAADLGDGWAFAEIRASLRSAHLTNRTIWDVFDELGEDLGVPELRELAASALLAGDQGARIRASLSAKADSMRANQTAAIEAQAEAATEKMRLPVITLVVGMILFIGFGVVQAISTPGTLP